MKDSTATLLVVGAIVAMVFASLGYNLYDHLIDQSWRRHENLRPGTRKLTPDQITQARTLVGHGASRSHVARLIGVTTTTVSNAVDRKRAYRDT